MKTYKTKDFYLAALLMCKGFKLTGSSKEPNAVYFHFNYDNDEKLQAIVNQFINYEAYVNLGKLVKIQALLRRELDKYKNK
jgi:hypothetical protein